MLIGTFEKDRDGYYGKIKTMLLNISVSIKPMKSNGNEKAPTHRLYSKSQSGVEIGVGWLGESKSSGNEYMSVKLDCPALHAPISANLIEKEGKYLLLWDRE